jgi:hypothetical protein
MKINRFLPLITPMLGFLISEVFFFWPKSIFFMLIAAVTLFYYTLKIISKSSDRNKASWHYLILPASFYISLIFFTALIPGKIIVQSLLVLNLVFSYLYFRAIYIFLMGLSSYQEHSLENISAYGNFLAAYFIFSSIFGFESYLNISVWQLILIMLVAVSLIVFEDFWVNKIHFTIGLFYTLIISLVLVELAWTASMLPLSFYVLGLVLAICYYMLVGLVRSYLLLKLDKKTIKLYLFYGFISIFIVLITSRWL